MLFTILMNLAFAFLGPLGAAALLIGDWLLNVFIVVKVVENVVPNGPAILGNATEMAPVVLESIYNMLFPIIAANYTGLTEELMNVTTPIVGDWFANTTTIMA